MSKFLYEILYVKEEGFCILPLRDKVGKFLDVFTECKLCLHVNGIVFVLCIGGLGLNSMGTNRYSSNSTFVILISEFSLKDLSCYMTLCYFSQQCQVARSCFFFPVGAPCPFVVYSSSPHQNLFL